MPVPDNDKQNQEHFLQLLRVADPELYMVKLALLEIKLNPLILVHILRSIGGLLIGSGYGTIKIYMQAKRINNVVGEEKTQIDEETQIDI